MSTPDPSSPTRASRRADEAATAAVAANRRKRRRRIIGWSVTGAAVVLLGAVGFAGYQVYERAMDIRGEMVKAQALIPTVTSSAAALDFEAAGAAVDQAAVHTANAVELSDDPLWRAAASVPVLGKNITAVDEIAAITNDALGAARPLVAAGPTLLPANFAPVDGAIPIQPLIDAQPVVHTAAEQLTAIDARLDAVDVDGTMDVLVSAKATLADGLGKVSSMLTSADTALSVAPTMLGATGPQTYVVAFLNNAELRSMGGTALSFAEVSVDVGRISLVQVVPAGFGNFARTPDQSIIPVPEGFEAIAPEGFGTFITNAGIRPSMQSLADVVTANWQLQFGRTPDAVVSMDVVALSYLLAATGSVQADEWTIDSTNVVDVLLNQVLNSFDSGNAALDNARQDAVYVALLDQTFSRLSAGQFDIGTMLDSVGKAVSERRILAWSANSEVEQVLVDAGMDAGIPDRAGEAAVVGLYLNDNVGSKLNYYLDTAVQTENACTAEASSRVTLTLTSTLDAAVVDDLNIAVSGEFEREKLEPGVQRMKIFAYAPTGSTITGASIDGQPVDLTGNTDAGHAVQVFTIELQPGASQQLAIDLTKPDDATSLIAEVTPSVRAAQMVTGSTC